MAATLSSTVKVSAQWSYDAEVDAGADFSVKDESDMKQETAIANGTGNSQADLKWVHYASLGDTATDTISLNALVQAVLSSDVTFDMQQIKAIMVVNHNDTAAKTGQDIILTNDSVSNAHTDLFVGQTAARLVIPAGGCQLVATNIDAWASGSTKLGLKVVNTQATAVTYSIAIIGVSA